MERTKRCEALRILLTKHAHLIKLIAKTLVDTVWSPDFDSCQLSTSVMVEFFNVGVSVKLMLDVE